MTEVRIESADEDIEARSALWRAICQVSYEIRNRFSVRTIQGLDGIPVQTDIVPGVATWQLVEALSLLAVILRSDDAKADVINLFGKSGPIEIREDNLIRFLWAQQTLQGEQSALGGRPDLIVTTSSEAPNSRNAVRIIEAKCVKQLGTPTVRSEFGKAYDLRVATYFIWSFYSPTQRVVKGARGLGIDLEALGFDTDRRSDLIQNPSALIMRVANAQEQARAARRFIGALEDSGREAGLKLRGLP